MYWWDTQLFSVKSRQKFLWRMTSHHTRIFYCSDMKNESNCFHKKTKWVNSVWMQDLYMLLRLDSISWLKTLKNSSFRELVVNTLFQEVTNHHNQKDGSREAQKLDPCWKSRPVICTANMELKSESGLWEKIILNPGSEFLMEQINMWLIQTTTTQKFLQIYLKNKRHNRLWRFSQPDQRRKQKPQRREPVDVPSIIPMNERKWIDVEPGESSFSAYEISKKVINLLRHSQTVQREDDGAVQFWRIKEHLQSQFPQIPHRSDNRWKACLAAGGGAKRRYQYCTDISGTIIYFRALQGHSGRNLIDPSLQDNVIIQSGLFQQIYHIGCAFNLHSIINNGLRPGGQNSSKRQTVFFLPIDPRDKGHQDPAKIDFNKPRRAQYLHSAWKKHQDAVFWVDINLAIQKGLTFYQTRSNAIILQGTLPAYCIPKVVRLKTGDVLYEKSYMSLRPPPKISLRHDHDWTRGNDELGSTVEQQPVGKIVQQSRGEVQHATFSQPTQPTQPIPKPICDRSGQPEDTQGVFVVKGETSRSHEIDEKGFHEKLCVSDGSGQPEITFNVIEARNLSENTRVEQTRDGSGQPDECNSSSAHTQWQNKMLLTNIVKLRHSTRTTSSLVQSTRRTLTSIFLAYRILLWSTRKVPAFENWFRNLRTTRIDMLFNETYDKVNHSIPSAKNQSKWFIKLETSNCLNYLIWNPKHSAKYVYHTGTSASSTASAGTSCATERRRTRNLSSTPWISSRFRITTKERATPRAPLREEARDYEYFVANSLKKKCKKKNFLGIHDRFIRDDKFRKNMFDVGRSEELCREMDKLANEDHTHHITAEEISVYRNNWWLRSNTVGSDTMPVRHRADFKQALSTLRQLKHQEDTAHQQRWKSYSSSWWNWQESWWHSSYEHHHEDGPSTDWSGKPVEKWLGYLFEVWFSELTCCIITVQNSVTANSSLLSPTGCVNTIPPIQENLREKWLRWKQRLRWRAMRTSVRRTTASSQTTTGTTRTTSSSQCTTNKYTNDDVDFDDCVVHIMHWVCT